MIRADSLSCRRPDDLPPERRTCDRGHRKRPALVAMLNIMSSSLYIYEQHAAEMLSRSIFELLIRECRGSAPIPVAVCWPCTEVALAGAVEAAESGLIVPQLVGSSAEAQPRKISRADSAETRVASCAVASVLVHHKFIEVMS